MSEPPASPLPAAGCVFCGGALLRTEHGELCTACLFRAGLDEGAAQAGPYQLLQPLDLGGTGAVYIARHRDQDELVAIKVARPELLKSSEALTAFRYGIRLQMELRGLPNIVSTYDLGTHADGRPYAVMPLLDGGTLADEAHASCRDKPREPLELLITIARAVALAHQRGVLHCDLKPENILFDAEGTPFVGDFGLARLVRKSNGAPSAMLQGGTPGWMSPEQALQQELTTASDVFSLGLLLYWLLTGSLAFGQDVDFARRVVSEPAPKLRDVYRGRLHWELDQICARALRKQPELRYRSAGEFVDDLVRARDGFPIEGERRRPVRRAIKWMRRHKLAALAGVEACLLLIYLPLMPIAVFREVRSTLREQIRFSAVAQAGAVMNELRALARRVEQLAEEPELRGLVQQSNPYQDLKLSVHFGGFDGLSIFSPDGRLRARYAAATLCAPHARLLLSRLLPRAVGHRPSWPARRLRGPSVPLDG